MKIYNKEKTAILENPDLTMGYIANDTIVRIVPEQKEIKEQAHYVTIRTYDNGGSDVEKVVDVPYQAGLPEHEEIENIKVYIPYTETELLEMKKQELRAWRKKYFLFSIFGCNSQNGDF